MARNTLIIKKENGETINVMNQCDNYKVLFSSLDICFKDNNYSDEEKINRLLALSNTITVNERPNKNKDAFIENIWIFDFKKKYFFCIDSSSFFNDMKRLNLNLITFLCINNKSLIEQWIDKEALYDVLLKTEPIKNYRSVFSSTMNTNLRKNSQNIFKIIQYVVVHYPSQKNIFDLNSYEIFEENEYFNINNFYDLSFLLDSEKAFSGWYFKKYSLNNLRTILFLYKLLLNFDINPKDTGLNWELRAFNMFVKDGQNTEQDLDRYKDIEMFFLKTPFSVDKKKIKNQTNYIEKNKEKRGSNIL